MSKTTHAKVVIIGSGPAGFTAAIYAARAMLEPVVIEGAQPGGQLTITTEVENYPGYADGVQGPGLMELLQKQAEHVGTQISTTTPPKSSSASGRFGSRCGSGDVSIAETLIIATGAAGHAAGSTRERSKLKGMACRPAPPAGWIFLRGQETWSSSAAGIRQLRGRRCF